MGTIDLGPTLLAAADGDKYEAPELLVLIVVPLVLSFILLRIAQRRRGPAWQRWASLVPLVAGALMAIDPFGDILMASYLDFHNVSDRSVYLHYAALIVPCATILGIVAYLLYLAHRERMER